MHQIPSLSDVQTCLYVDTQNHSQAKMALVIIQVTPRVRAF